MVKSPAGLTILIASTGITLIVSVVKFQDAFAALVANTPAIKSIQQEQIDARAERDKIFKQLKQANKNLYRLCKKNGIYPVELEGD